MMKHFHISNITRHILNDLTGQFAIVIAIIFPKRQMFQENAFDMKRANKLLTARRSQLIQIEKAHIDHITVKSRKSGGINRCKICVTCNENCFFTHSN